eukprot:scaffold82819_cov70-Phaeocystis_antarctica.AAC.4
MWKTVMRKSTCSSAPSGPVGGSASASCSSAMSDVALACDHISEPAKLARNRPKVAQKSLAQGVRTP